MSRKMRKLLAMVLVLMLIGADLAAVAEEIGALVLPSALRIIDKEAFYGDTSIGKVVVPDGAKEIRSKAFADSSLTEIELPDTLTSIAEDAFDGCEDFEITAEEGSYAYEWAVEKGYIESTLPPNPASDFRYSISDGECTITGYIGSATEVVIPKKIEGATVTSIGGKAFYWCDSLTSITIPEGVTSIGEMAFYWCDSLTSITVDEGNTAYLSEDGILFSKDKSKLIHYPAGKTMQSYSIPEGVTKIGDDAFYGCSNLTSITIPEGVTSIGDYAFDSCRNLTSIIIPKSMTSIGDDAFARCSGLMKVSILGGATTIGRYAFYYCENLMSVTINGSIDSIGYAAFENCSSLTDIEINGNITYIDSEVFEKCTALTKIEIPDGIKYIGQRAFCACSNLTSVTINGSDATICGSAFASCVRLTSVELNGNFTSIGSSAFSGCYKLASIAINGRVGSIGDNAFYDCRSLQKIIIPDGCSSIGGNAFQYCDNLMRIVIPESVTYIGGDAFWKCPSNYTIYGKTGSYAESYAGSRFVEYMYFNPDGEFDYSINNGEATIIRYTGFERTVKIPETIENCPVTSIYSHAFSYCKTANSITISDRVVNIGDRAFFWCSALTSITIPESVVNIGDEAFSDCFALTSITIPESVVNIGDEAFSTCWNLTSITIPKSVTSIGKMAFCGCSKLTNILVDENNVVYSSENGILFDKNKSELICYPEGKSAYAYVIPSSVKKIGDGAFSFHTELTSITIPEGVTSIGNHAFSDCYDLNSITIPNSVTNIGNYAFSGCSDLNSITIPEGVTSIGNHAFSRCSSLTSITIPNSVTSIGTYAFSECSSLTAIFIPESVTEIGSAAFSYRNKNLVIYGEAGSYAETYAKEQGIAFSTKDWNYGDKAQYVSVSGCVQTEDGTPIANAYITIHSDGDHKTSTTAVTDSTGNWSVDGIWAGRSYTLECAAAGFKFESRTFRTGTSDKNLGVIIGTADGTFVLLDQQVVRADASGMERTITVTSNDTWTVKASADWMHVSSESGEGKGTFTLSIDENAGKFRSGAVTVIGTKQECTIYVLQSGALSKKLDDPVITTPAENGITVPYGDIEVAWDGVEYADHYVISLRDITTNELLIFHDEKAITGENTATLLEDYFFDGREYRMAIGAVPAGVDSTDPLVSWCERVINVAAIEVAEDATLSGRVYGQQIDADDGKVTKEPLYGAVVVIAQVVDGVEDIVGSVVTDEKGYWTFENCIIGGMYRIYAYASENNAPVLPQTYSDYDVVVASNVSASLKDDDLQLKLQTGAGVNDTGIQIVNLSDEEAIIQANIQNAAAGLKSGLLAQYFQSKKGDYTARAKRWEEVVATVDFSWEEGTNGRMMSHNQYDKLITHKYDGSGSLSDVLYVKRNDFSAKFTGYLIVGETDTYDLRATGDDGVKLTVTKLNGKNATDSDGWWFGGSNQKAKVSLELEAGVRYPIMLEYYNNGEAANVKLEWKKKSEKDTAYTIIPEANLFYDYSEHKSVRSRAMETLVEMVTVNEKLQETPKTIIKNMATKNFNSYVSDNFFNLDDAVYSSLEDKIKDTAKNTVVKKSVECGFEILVGYSIDPNWAKEDIKEVILDGLKKYTIDLSDTINEKIDDIRENWKVDVADAQVDTTEFLIEFYAWLYEFLPEQYEDIVGEIASEIGYASSDAMFVELNKSFSGKDTLKDGAKEVQKEYKEVRNVFDLAKENMENVKYYKDNNRVRSYLHLMFLEDSDGTYEKYKNLVWLTSYQSPTKETFISCLNDSNNENLKAFLKNYDSYETETEILIYKQLLLSIIEYASDDIFSFYGN